jgi:hypothetical protein
VQLYHGEKKLHFDGMMMMMMMMSVLHCSSGATYLQTETFGLMIWHYQFQLGVLVCLVQNGHHHHHHHHPIKM